MNVECASTTSTMIGHMITQAYVPLELSHLDSTVRYSIIPVNIIPYPTSRQSYGNMSGFNLSSYPQRTVETTLTHTHFSTHLQSIMFSTFLICGVLMRLAFTAPTPFGEQFHPSSLVEDCYDVRLGRGYTIIGPILGKSGAIDLILIELRQFIFGCREISLKPFNSFRIPLYFTLVPYSYRQPNYTRT